MYTNLWSVRVCICPESNLQVLKQDCHLNLTMKPPAFDISCNITSRTSQTSELQVTWFSRRATGGEGDATLPIFRAHRDFTLHDLKRPGHRLSFGRPSPSLYALAVTMATPSDSSVYHCEVEEWLQSPSLTWRRVAQDRSGDLTVSVHAEGTHTYTHTQTHADTHTNTYTHTHKYTHKHTHTHPDNTKST